MRLFMQYQKWLWRDKWWMKLIKGLFPVLLFVIPFSVLAVATWGVDPATVVQDVEAELTLKTNYGGGNTHGHFYVDDAAGTTSTCSAYTVNVEFNVNITAPEAGIFDAWYQLYSNDTCSGTPGADGTADSVTFTVTAATGTEPGTSTTSTLEAIEDLGNITALGFAMVSALLAAIFFAKVWK